MNIRGYVKAHSARGILVSGIATLLLACAVPQSPTEVGDTQIALFRAGIEDGCRKDLLRRGLGSQRTEANCRCVLGAYDRNWSKQAWQSAAFAAGQRDLSVAFGLRSPFAGELQACYER
jgi:hypothetical protein